MLAFHDESKRIARPTTWELRLSDSAFTARADGTNLTVTAGAPESADLVITTKDEHLHRLMTRQLTPDTAVATGAVTVNGDATALPRLLELLVFPPSE